MTQKTRSAPGNLKLSKTTVNRNSAKSGATEAPPIKTASRGLGPNLNATIAKIIKREMPRSLPNSRPFPDRVDVSKFRAFISIGDTGPDVWIENRQGWIEFSVVNFSDAPIPASFVKITVKPKHSLQSYPGNFEFPIDVLQTFGSVQGALSLLLPRADVGNQLTVTWYTFGPVAGEFQPIVVIDTAELDFAVGAKFTIGMNPIYIRNTASHHNDTLYVALTGQQNGTLYTENAALGDHDNTDGRNGVDPGVLPVGPFTLVPGSGEVISVSGVITNNGHSSKDDDDKNILDTISKVGAVVATTVLSIVFPAGSLVWAALSAAVDAAQEAIINWAFANCDTAVWVEAITPSEDTLFTATFDPNDKLSGVSPVEWSFRIKKKKGDQFVDWLGGGCEDSDYSSGFSLQRLRASEVPRFIVNDGISLAPDQVANFAPLYRDGTLRIEYANIGRGSTDNFGNYEAPMDITTQKFDIVTWKAIRDTPNGFYVVWTDFAIVILD